MAVIDRRQCNNNIAFVKAIRYRLERDYNNMPVETVLRYMHDWGMENASVGVKGVWSGREWGRVFELTGTNIIGQPARAILCRFIGGPPGSVQTYKGTLFSLFMDRAMSMTAVKGYEAIQRLFPRWT